MEHGARGKSRKFKAESSKLKEKTEDEYPPSHKTSEDREDEKLRV